MLTNPRENRSVKGAVDLVNGESRLYQCHSNNVKSYLLFDCSLVRYKQRKDCNIEDEANFARGGYWPHQWNIINGLDWENRRFTYELTATAWTPMSPTSTAKHEKTVQGSYASYTPYQRSVDPGNPLFEGRRYVIHLMPCVHIILLTEKLADAQRLSCNHIMGLCGW